MLQDKKARRHIFVPLIVDPNSLDFDTPTSKVQVEMAELMNSGDKISIEDLRKRLRKPRYRPGLKRVSAVLLCGVCLLGELALLCTLLL